MRPSAITAAAALAALAVLASVTSVAAVAGCTPSGKEPLPFFVMQGSAYLLPFYSGVVQGLTDAGALKPTTRLAGLSGGALTAALTAMNVSGSAQFNETTRVLQACAAKGVAGCHPLNGQLAVLLQGLLPPNAGAEVGDRVRVWVSALPDVTATNLTNSVPLGVTNFTSADDLEAALFASDMIPCFSDERQYNLVRGVPAIDGGFACDFRELCADAAAAGARCVTAATAVVNPKATADTGASLRGCPAVVSDAHAFPADSPRAGAGGTVPLPAPTLPRDRWALPATCTPGADPAAAWPPFIAQGSTLQPQGAMPDIYPGARSAALADWRACDWLSFALKPDFSNNGARWTAVYEAGLAEAAAWAVEEGYCVEKAGGAAAQNVAAQEGGRA